MSTKIAHQKYKKETLLSQQQRAEERSEQRGADKRADKAELKSK